VQLAGVVLFSAFPFTIVKAIANSSIGEQLQQRMLETKAVAKQEAGAARAAESNARDTRFFLPLIMPLAESHLTKIHKDDDLEHWEVYAFEINHLWVGWSDSQRNPWLLNTHSLLFFIWMSWL
jgi:hypothetical protein